MILADESLSGLIVNALRAKDFKIDWVLEISPGISDEMGIKLAKKTTRFS